MACESRINFKTGTIEVSGDDASEVEIVMLSLSEHLQLFAEAHPAVLDPPPPAEIHLGDRYQVVGQHVSVGPNAQTTVDLQAVSTELELLRSHLRAVSSSPADDLDLSALAEAQIAANASDEKGVLTALRRVGKRTLDLAQDVGASVASAVILRALGMS